MIVKELIKKLQSLPKEATVVVSGDDNFYFVASDVAEGHFRNSTFLYPDEWEHMEGQPRKNYPINAIRIG